MIPSKYQQCTRCVMDTSDPDITFAQNGFCNHCTEYIERTSKRSYQGKESEAQLNQIVDRIRESGKSKEYDCVLGVSGGIDSSYAAYTAKKLGLRALLVHMDNGWNSEVSVKNIKNIADKLGFDYESYVLDWDEFKDLQLAFLKASVPEIETPTDIAIPAALHRVAAKHGVKFIVSGGNFATEGILPKVWHYNGRDVKYLKHIHKKFGSKKLKSFPLFGWLQEAYYKFARGIRTIYVLNYVPFSKKDAMAVLEKEIGWRYYGGKHYESKYTSFVQSYILPVKFNIDYRRATFSTQICTGEISRDEALEKLKNSSYDTIKVEEEKQYICKKLGISVAQFNDFLRQSPKWYREYPNDEKFLDFIYGVYRKLYSV